MARVSVVDLIEYEKWTHYVVVLREEGTSRILPIWIGQNEAWPLVQALLGERWVSPSTHDFAAHIFQAAQLDISEISIVAMQDEVFQAQVTVRRAGEKISIAGRPSDAIALALHLGAVLLVDDDLLHQHAMDLSRVSGTEPEWGRGLREIVKDWREAIDAAKAKPTPVSDEVLSAAYQWVAGFIINGRS